MNCRFLIALGSLVIFLTGCAPTPTPTSTPMPNPPKTIRFLALGDSYTIGENVFEADRWPVQLSNVIEVSPYNREIDVNIIARTGWTTNELWSAIQQNPPQGVYDLVSLLIGVNDQYRGGSPEKYRQDFRFLLGKAVAYAGGDPQHVVVLSIPDWGATPFGQRDRRGAQRIGAEIDAFNAINREETLAAGARYVDITPISRQASADPTLVAADGLHPSGKMYAAWVELALPEALSALEFK